jgi:RHS repeat-associated protein
VVVTKYYFFGGQRIARRSSVDGYKPFYLHADHLLSTVLESNEAGAATADQKYHAYGTQRDSGKVASEQRFTGQREDDTGLVYMNARYYDPQLGQFISPDTLVPQPALLVDYNRYVYARNNPLKFSDPSGHVSVISHCMCGGGIDPSEYMRNANMQLNADDVQLALDVVGIVDPTGLTDGANAAISATRGNWSDAGISLLAVIPYIGDTAKAGKYVGKAAGVLQGVNRVDDVVSSTELAAKLGLKNFTQSNYRKGLIRYTGVAEEAVKGFEAHHIFPQEFMQRFTSAGIDNIHDPRYLSWVVPDKHARWSYEYNKAWDEFLQGHPDRDAILRKAQDLAEEYGFDINFHAP